MTEEWREVPGFPGYEVSDAVRVRSYKQRSGSGLGAGAHWIIAKTPQRYLALAPTGGKNRKGHPRGYRQLMLSHNGQKQHFNLHQLVALAWYGPCPEGMEVCHNDGNAANNHPSNLRYDLPEGNYEDQRKQTRARVQGMRKEHAEGETVASLAKRYDLSPRYVQRILAGTYYRAAGGPTHSFITYKLSDPEVIRMRNMRAAGIALSVLAEFFHVDQSAVSRITRGLRRQGVGGPITETRVYQFRQ